MTVANDWYVRVQKHYYNTARNIVVSDDWYIVLLTISYLNILLYIAAYTHKRLISVHNCCYTLFTILI